jgi:cupin superfamily acireductone dioxygenase involved in methionine salvage
LDEFFDSRESYNNQTLAEFLNDKEKPHNHSEDEVRYYLEWYARLNLGKKIYDCILEQGSCSFEAEL